MTDQTEDTGSDLVDDVVTVDELTLLKQRARTLGITFSNNISLETLKQRVSAVLDGTSTEEVEETAPVVATERTRNEVRRDKLAQSMKLVRLRITNLDPKKKSLQGEIVTVANGTIGTVRKFIPFGDQSENGYHVPYVIYQYLKEKKFQHIRSVKDKRTGTTSVVTSMVSEYALEVLPQLTAAELAELKASQAASSGS